MQPERRGTPRERPEELSYIQFEPEGGGIVLNASEHGLGFHVAATLRQRGPIQLCVSPNPMQQIKLTAKIIWMDQANKSGGLRFTEVTADARNEIRQWLCQTGQPEAPDRQFVVPSCAPKEETGACLQVQNATPGLLPPTPASHSAIQTGAGAQTAASVAVPFSQEKQTLVFRPRELRSVATGFLIVVLMFTPIVFVQNLRREIGDSFIRIGEKLRGTGDSGPSSSSSIPRQLSQRSSANAPPVPKLIPETPGKETLEQSNPAASTQTTQGTENSGRSRPPDVQNSRQHLADAHSTRDRSALARQLWSEVGGGDSSAEVALAQLYLKGDGVPRNCEQARVLLRAASKGGNTEALLELRKLRKGTCR
jgi:hypothetical protein